MKTQPPRRYFSGCFKLAETASAEQNAALEAQAKLAALRAELDRLNKEHCRLPAEHVLLQAAAMN